MIRIIQGFNRDDVAAATMFEDRKRLFVDMLGWNVPIVDGCFEIDGFDNDFATYVVATADHGEHIGSMRLLPSTRPHILGNLFPVLCDGDVPVGEANLEITRLCLPVRLGTAGRLAVRNRLISAMVDHCLGIGITSLTGVVRWNFLEQILRMGWRCAPLGGPTMIGGARLGAFRIDLDGETRLGLAATSIYEPGTIALAALCEAA
jgi:acyl-homoserine lactone synthase